MQFRRLPRRSHIAFLC